MANSTITTTYLPDDRVRFIVSIGVGDPIEYWKVMVSAKQDHGLGQTGGDYPNFVEKITGVNNTTFYRARSSLYFADSYAAELRLPGIDGTVDYDIFTIPGGPPPPPTNNYGCNPSGQCVQGYGSLPAGCNGTCVPPPPTQYHNICQNNVCTQVSGAGANECSTPGVNCTHKVCWNNVCTALDGPGTDECTTIGAACGTPTPTLASITIPSTASVQVGTTKTLSTICKNSNGSTITCPTLTWGSGNNSIVTVNNGVITGVSAGTMSVNCWDSVSGIASNTCQVTVTSISPPPDGCTNPKYKCGGANNQYCISDNCDGTGSFSSCSPNPCGTPTQCPSTDQINIFGTCYDKNDVYMAVGAIVLLMVLTRK